MEQDRAKARRDFIVTAIFCGIFFGLPFLISFLRIISQLFQPYYRAASYWQFDATTDVLAMMVLAAFTVLPPLAMFFHLGLDKPAK